MDETRPQGHAPTELLSAYLDRQVEPDEAVLVERHLPGCAHCSFELSDLDAVRALVHRLPQVAPPRSFVLREPAPMLRLPQLVIWTRAAAALAALVFAVVFSLDMSGLAARLAVPMAASSQTAAPVAPAIRAAPQSTPRRIEVPSPDQAIGANHLADSTIESLTTGPLAPLSRAAAGVSISPLRLAWIVSGLVAFVLIGCALLVGRRTAGSSRS